MSRARNIKPAFFANEDLVEMPFEYRLLFIGLWTLADREGRLEDRPKRIKMQVFPADDVDIEAGLTALHSAGMVLRYEVNGNRYIAIPAWKKHQNPHCRESASKLPPPGKTGASPVQAQCKHGASPADSLIPDSLIQKPRVGNSPPSTESTNARDRATSGGGGPPASGQALAEAAHQANPALAAVVRLRRRRGEWLRLTPTNPEIHAAVAEGVTVEAIEAFAEAYPDKPPLYVIRAARRDHAETAAPIPPGGTHHARGPHAVRGAVEETLAAIERRRQRDNATLENGDG